MVKYLVIVLIIVALWLYFNNFPKRKFDFKSTQTQFKWLEEERKMIEILRKLALIYEVELWRCPDSTLEGTFKAVEKGIVKHNSKLVEKIEEKDEKIRELEEQINIERKARESMATSSDSSSKKEPSSSIEIADFVQNMLKKKTNPNPFGDKEFIQKGSEKSRGKQQQKLNHGSESPYKF